MSSPPELLGFSVGADTSEAEDALGGLGQVADGLGVGLEERLNGASESLQELGKRSSTTSRGIQGFASVLALVDPRAAQAARSVGTLARGLSVFRLGLGPAAAAVGLVVGALALYNKEQELKAKIEADAQVVTEALISSERRLKDAYTDLAAEASEVAKRELQIANARRTAFAESLPGLQAISGQVAETRLLISQLQDEYDDVSSRPDVGLELRGVSSGAAEQTKERLNAAADRLKSLESDQRQLIENLRDEAKARADALQVQFDEVDASKASAKAKREEAAASKAAGEADALRAEVAGLIQQAEGEGVDAATRLNQVYAQRIARLDEIQRETGGTAELEAAYAAVTASRDRELHALRMEEIEAEAEAKRRAAEEDQRRLDEEKAHRQQVAQALTQFGQQSAAGIAQAFDESFQVSSDNAARLQQQLAAGEEFYTAAQRKELEARIAAQQEAAKKQFERAKAASLAEVAINTAVGISDVWSKWAANPALAVLLTAGVAAAGGTQIAAISAQNPAFHRGGLGDEYTATMRRNEAVLNPLGRQAMGDEGVRRANAGQSPGGDRIVVVERYRHQTFNRFIKDGLSMGNPISDLVASDGAGHRNSRKGI